MNITKTFSLPSELADQWSLTEIISFNGTSTICKVQNIATKIDHILKIYSTHSFSQRKYSDLSKLSDSHFILPKEHIHLHRKDYIFYPMEESLKDIIYNSGLSLREILCLGIHMIEAISLLTDTGIYEADISPCNIYRNSKGIFCLGDINLEKCDILGTHPYVAPEYTEKTSDSRAFDLAMQYSVCSLLHSVCKLQKDFLFDELNDILRKGMEQDPKDRFSSLMELKRSFTTLFSHEKISSKNILILHRRDHPLFYTKTLPVPKSGYTGAHYIACILLMVSILFFIFSLHRYNTIGTTSAKSNDYITVLSTAIPADTNMPTITGAHSSEPVDLSRSSLDPDNSGPVDSSLSSPDPVNTPKTQEIEIDLQNKNYYSFSRAVKGIKTPSHIMCLYAGNNHFKDLDNISSLVDLRELYMNNNQLTDISDISKCADMTILILSYNDIRDVSPISSLTSLEHLDLSSNMHLSGIDALDNLNHLNTLNISNTNVSQKEYRQLVKKLPACHIIY